MSLPKAQSNVVNVSAIQNPLARELFSKLPPPSGKNAKSLVNSSVKYSKIPAKNERTNLDQNLKDDDAEEMLEVRADDLRESDKYYAK